MKKLCFLLSLIIILSSLPISAISADSFSDEKAPFTDVKESDWFYSNVCYVYENGIMNGVPENRFAPQDTMSRAMSVTILYRMADKTDIDGVTHPFTDVPSGQWYSDAVTWAYNSEIVNGVSDTEFAPDKTITRAEFATMFWRYAQFADLGIPKLRGGSVKDETNIPFYARTAVIKMYQGGVINGRTGYKFEPKAEISRAEAAAIIERFIKSAVPKDQLPEPAPEYDPELYLDVSFMGNSIFYTGGLPSHFDTICDDRLIYVRDFSKTLFSMDMHYNYFTTTEEGKKQLEEIRKSDIIVSLGLPLISSSDGTDPEALIDLIGRDKKYYAISPYDGPHVDYSNSDLSEGNNPIFNDVYLDFKETFLEEYGVEMVYLSGIVNFDPKVGLKEEDFKIKGDWHPNGIFGYSMALGIYCTMFDERTEEQNGGELSLYEIPGETEEEKAEYIKLLKNTVQRILDSQK